MKLLSLPTVARSRQSRQGLGARGSACSSAGLCSALWPQIPHGTGPDLQRHVQLPAFPSGSLSSRIFSCLQTGGSRQDLIYLRQIKVRPPVQIFARWEFLERRRCSSAAGASSGLFPRRYLHTWLCCRAGKSPEEQPRAVPGATRGKPGFCGRRSHRAGRMLGDKAPALQVVSCPVSAADTGSQEKFAVPGPSPVRGSVARRAEPSSEAGLAACRARPGRSSHGSAQCQCRGVPEVGWEQRVPAKRVGRGWSVSRPATPTPSHPHGASLSSSSVPFHTPARNPALALPGRLQVWRKALPELGEGSAAPPCRQGWGTRSITAEKCQISGTTSVLQTAAKATCESRPGWSRARSMGHGPTAAGFEDDGTLTHLFF